MVTAIELARQIKDAEGLSVGISAPPGTEFEDYRYERRAKGSMTVAGLIEKRLKPSAKGYAVEVFDRDGKRINGRTKVETARNK